MRRICAEGIRLARSLRGKKWKDRKWHIERYFIKELIEAEWMVDNYRGLIDAVKRNIYGKKRELPIGFIGRYGIALARSHAEDDCLALIKYAKNKIGNKNSEPYILVLLVEAIQHYICNHQRTSLRILKRISNYAILSPNYRINVYTYLMLNYKYLGLSNEYRKYYSKLIRSSNEDDVPYARLLAMHVETESLFLRSYYTKARSKLRTIIKLAAGFKTYRLLYEAYFLASAVYFEEQQYTQALNYLGKAIQLSLDLGLKFVAITYSSHYAMIYQKMGRYGDAIRHAEYAMNRLTKKRDIYELFYSLIILLDLYCSINNRKASTYMRKAANLSNQIHTLFRLGYYYFLRARYNYQAKEYKDAYKDYRTALNIYSAINQEDDIVRCYYGMAYICLNTNRYKEARSLLARAKKKSANMESIELKAEYYKCNLAYYYITRSNKRALNHYLKLCLGIRSHIKDILFAMDYDIMLFRVNARLGNIREATNHFRNYRNRIKVLLANLDNEQMRSELINNSEFVLLTRELELLRRKNRISSSCSARDSIVRISG
jgi:tetratricopeptide (TPR) repeat protein